MPFFKHLLLGFILLPHCATLWAQNADSLRVNFQQTEQPFASWWRVDAVEMGGAIGRMLVTDQYQRAWTQQTNLSAIVLALRHRTTADSCDAFAHDYNYPSWALSLQWADLSGVTMQKRVSPWWGQLQPVDYASHPGHLFVVAGTFSRPFQHFRWGEWGYSLEEGVAFNTRPYRRENNADNELTGSPLLFHFGASLYGEVRLTSHFSLRADLAFRHVSNGATHRPNKGANMWQPTLALQYDLKPQPRHSSTMKSIFFATERTNTSMESDFFKESSPYRFSPYWWFHVEGNIGVRTLLEEWLQTQYHTDPSDANYRTDHFQRHTVYNLQADVMRRYARRWALGAGLDVFTLPYVKQLQRFAPEDAKSRTFSPISFGVALKHESFYGRLSSYIHLGYYIYRETGRLASSDELPYYERVGLRYRLGKRKWELKEMDKQGAWEKEVRRRNRGVKYGGITFNIGIKAHKLKADFAEIGIGWDF